MDLATKEVRETQSRANSQYRSYHTLKTDGHSHKNRCSWPRQRSLRNLTHRTPCTGSVVLCDKHESEAEQNTYTTSQTKPDPGGDTIIGRHITGTQQQIASDKDANSRDKTTNIVTDIQ